MGFRNTFSRGRRGFTLVELVVSLGVILLLAGLTLSVGVAVLEQSERRSTANSLDLLDAAVREWELATGRKLSWWQPPGGIDRDAADVRFTTNEVLIITEILDVVARPTGIKEILARLDPDVVHTYQAGVYPPWIDNPMQKLDIDNRFSGAITVLDAWGNPIYATHPGRLFTENDRQMASVYAIKRDVDGTIRTVNEGNYGIAPNRQVVFVSAGPDGYFGFVGEFLNRALDLRFAAAIEARKDNVYSTPVTYTDSY